nr:MAG TPA: hypothetical protein [Caudoviricetes sp.]
MLLFSFVFLSFFFSLFSSADRVSIGYRSSSGIFYKFY